MAVNLDAIPFLYVSIAPVVHGQHPGTFFYIRFSEETLHDQHDYSQITSVLDALGVQQHTISISGVVYTIIFEEYQYMPMTREYSLRGRIIRVNMETTAVPMPIPVFTTPQLSYVFDYSQDYVSQIRDTLPKKAVAPGCTHDPVVKRKRALVL